MQSANGKPKTPAPVAKEMGKTGNSMSATKSVKDEMKKTGVNKVERFTEGPAEGSYREVIHASLNKIGEIKRFLGEGKIAGYECKIQDMQGEKKETLEKILRKKEDPEDANCRCEICICGKHLCPNRLVHCKYPSTAQSLYQQDFIKHPFDEEINEYNANKLGRPVVPHKMDSASTYKREYPPHLIGKPESKLGKRPVTAAVPFYATSHYQNNFVDWGATQMPPATNTAKNYKIPFQGKSTYGDTFIPIDLANRARPMKPINISEVDKHFNAVTTKMIDFKPFKIEGSNAMPKRKEVKLTPSYPGQYDTTMRKDYTQKKIDKICPAEKEAQAPDFSKSSAYFNPIDKVYYV